MIKKKQRGQAQKKIEKIEKRRKDKERFKENEIKIHVAFGK